ncbi:MAG: 50S ribosomal protein L15 [Candidatus Levybacteria bacterium RIFCSPHIGHO2_01_FULL_40_10]|nr:MAG: 50S ribosomal protein L15 [Candidatus Levybacteria bacterium RIFCSPHIGHO2_01_FULL_40_10]
MQLSNLPKLTEKRLRRLGRGHGSGRGKTSGRGTKGQNARGKVGLFFEGGALPLTKRLPFLRGRGRNKIVEVPPFTINVSKLADLPAKSIVDIEMLVKKKLVDFKANKSGVKVIGKGDLKVALSVKLPTTAGAKKIIEAAGGTVE